MRERTVGRHLLEHVHELLQPACSIQQYRIVCDVSRGAMQVNGAGVPATCFNLFCLLWLPTSAGSELDPVELRRGTGEGYVA